MTLNRLGIAFAITAATFGVAFAQSTKSVWTGVYTSAQATTGADLYEGKCAECHGDDLEGRERAPALAGGTFAQRWDRATLKTLFERVEAMPPDRPGGAAHRKTERRSPGVSVERQQRPRGSDAAHG